MRRRKLLGSFSVVALLATLLAVGATAVSSPASAWIGPDQNTTAAVNLACKADAPIIGETDATQAITLDTTAPNKVEVGETFTARSQATAGAAPSEVQGYTINNLRAFEIRIPVPAGSTRVSESIVGGTGFNYGTANLTYDGGNNRWVFTVSGPIAGGSNFQFPAIDLTVTATGSAGSFIQPKIGGTSKTDFGFKLTVNAALPIVGNSDIPTSCWPSGANPALASTQILPVDTTGPAITVTTPGNGATYAQNAAIPASYSCDDGALGTGTATCVGTVANGAGINTSSVGPQSFTVNATDVKGNASTQTVNYTVVDSPGLTAQPAWAFEGTQAQFAVSLSKPWPIPVTVQYQTVDGSAVAGVDYTNTSGTLTFNPGGPLVQNVNVNTAASTTYRGERRFDLSLFNATNALINTASTDGRILDDETPPPEATGDTVDEGPGAVVDFEVSIPLDPVAPVDIGYQTADGFALAGDDYQFTSGTLTFNPGGPLTQTVSVPVIDDPEDDGYAIDFSLEVTNNDTGEVGVAGQAVIIDNDGPPPIATNVGANIGDVLVVEGDDTSRTAWLTVRLDQPAPADITFNYTTADGSATAASKDYKAETKSLVFKAGQTARTVSITITPDTLAEGDEELYVDLTFIGGGKPIGDSRGTITIQDDDSPTASDYVISMGDAATYEGNSALGVVDLPLTVNKKRPNGAPDEDIPVRVDIVYGTANATDVQVSNLGWTITFPGGVNKNVQLKVRGDSAVEPDEQLTVVASTLPATPPSASIGRATGTLTIRDDDGIPGAPLNPSAVTSTTQLGGVDVTWDSPATGQPPTSYEWRVATDGTLDTETFVSTETGLNRHIVHDCGEGNTCEYQIRAVNLIGAGPATGVVDAVGLEDNTAPDLLVFNPKPGANTDSSSTLSYNGLVGTAIGDEAAVTVNVYPCSGCTNVAPIQSFPATVLGAGWSATGPALAPGVYTVEAVQTDWVGNTTSVTRVIEARNAVFVSATGNNANPGTAASPKQTINAGLATAASESRPEVVVGQGVYGAVSVTNAHNNTTVRGGFDQYAGWVRPGSAGVPGTPSADLTSVEAGGTAILTAGATGVTLESLKARGLNAGQPAGSSIYSIRATAGSDIALQNVKTQTQAGVQGAVGATGGNGTNGSQGGLGQTGSAGCADNAGAGSGLGGTAGGGASANGRDGGAGGRAACNTGTGITGGNGLLAPPAGGGAGGVGGVSETDIFICIGGQNSSTGGTGGQAGGGGTSGQAGHGGGGGGGGGGGMNACFAGQDRGGGGGGGGGGGNPGATGGNSTSPGGDSYGVYADNSSVTIDAASLIEAGDGGQGGTGGTGGNGGNGGNGRDGGNGFGDASGGGGGAGGGGGGGGVGGQGAAGGRSVAVFHQGTGSVTVSATLTPGSPGSGGLGGNGGAGGNGGNGGAGGIDGADPTGGPGGPGSPGNAGSAGAPGAVGPSGAGSCKTLIGGVCTP